MADFAGRLRTLEKKVNFLMDHMQMKAVVSTGVLGPDGKPTPSKVFQGSLNELYQLSRTLPVLSEAEADPPPVEE